VYINKAQQKAFDLQIELIQSTISEYQSLKDALQSTFDSITGSDANAMSYMTAQSVLIDSLTSAQNGQLPDLDSIGGALDAVRNNSTNGYATLADYNRDQSVTANVLSELIGYTDAAITVEDQMLTELQAQTDALNSLNVVTVGMGVNGSHANGLSRVPFDGYTAELHRDESVIDARTMSGLRRYGINTGGGSDKALIAEIRALRAEVTTMKDQLYGANIAIATSTGKTSRILDQWNDEGQPVVRVEVDYASS
jgi:hypothetical protein